MSDDAKESRVPLILIGVGVAVHILAAFVHGRPSGPIPTLLINLVGAVISTAILIGAALLVSTVLSVSFGEVRTAIPKFAGAVLICGAIGALIPFGGIVAMPVFLGLIVWLFELEIVYAIALAVANWIISLVVLGALLAMA